MFKIDIEKLVISDMDGTLLKSDKTIAQTTIDTVFEMRNKNIDFTIATGRIYPTVYDTMQKLKIQKPIILCNGAIIQDAVTEKIYFSKLIDQKLISEIIEKIDDFGSFFYFYKKDSLTCKDLKYTAKFYYESNKKITHDKKLIINLVDDMKKADIKDVCKIVVIEKDKQRLERIKQDLKIYEDYIEIFSSNWDNIEIVAKGISKGQGVQFLLKLLNYDMKNVMCVGDEQNDESMLLKCGFPVAMGNAAKDIKKIAKFVTDDNDNDGVSKAIRKFAQI